MLVAALLAKPKPKAPAFPSADIIGGGIVGGTIIGVYEGSKWNNIHIHTEAVGEPTSIVVFGFGLGAGIFFNLKRRRKLSPS